MSQAAAVEIAGRQVGSGHPTFIIAEIGINHNGSLDLAKQLIDGAHQAGVDAVKFQKRTPELCVPPEQWGLERDTPWGRMTYIDYRRRMEFSVEEYAEIDRHCRQLGILWFASCWDEEAVDFIERYDPSCYKIASASLTDDALLGKTRATGKPVLLSTGMSTLAEIDHAVEVLGRAKLVLLHATSTYPCTPENLNLNMIGTLTARFPECPIGYSGHETGLATTWAAVALGACVLERHITLDRALWGSDQAASVEIGGFQRLVSNVRDVEKALGDGIKKVYPGELSQIAKLRRVKTPAPAA